MKNFSIILAIFFLAFTVEAQTVHKSKRTKEKETTEKSVSRSNNKSSKTKAIRKPSAQKSSVNRPSNSASKSSFDRDKRNTSHSSATRSNESRNNRSVSPQSRTSTTRTTGNDANRTGISRKVNTTSSNNRERNNESGRVNTQQNRSSQSVRGYTPKTGESYIASRKVYSRNLGTRVYRPAPKVHYTHQPLDYRRVHYPYRTPNAISIYWNVNMYNNYRRWYPDFDLWYYPYGYRIPTVSAYDSYSYVGEIARIYGQVTEVYYSRETGEYYLYIGGPYPYQDFTIILEAQDARRFSLNPERFFTNRQLAVTGLVSQLEDKPEMLIRKRSQISIY